MIVLDTNIMISYFIDNGSNFDELFIDQVIAPSFQKIEVLNVLRKYHFLRQIPIKELDEIYDRVC